MPIFSGLLTFNNWDWVETLKNSFIFVELDLLHKKGLLSLSVTRVTTHSIKVSTTIQNSLQGE
jgi:hypothetical protein